MPVLHLGVIDHPYRNPPTKGHNSKASGLTTGDVAEILEAKYHVMETFVERNREEIDQQLSAAVGKAINAMMHGASSSMPAYGSATTQISGMFKDFISQKKMDGMPGVPTAASLRGVSHRKKHPYAKRGPRPSFSDTASYVDAFISWVD